MHQHDANCNVNTCEVMAEQARDAKEHYTLQSESAMRQAIDKLKERFNSR